jgi:hypothetical protein
LKWIAGELREFRRINCSVVAEKFKCSTKTALRDFDFLRDRLGYDLDYVREEQSYALIKAPEAQL